MTRLYLSVSDRFGSFWIFRHNSHSSRPTYKNFRFSPSSSHVLTIHHPKFRSSKTKFKWLNYYFPSQIEYVTIFHPSLSFHVLTIFVYLLLIIIWQKPLTSLLDILHVRHYLPIINANNHVDLLILLLFQPQQSCQQS